MIRGVGNEACLRPDATPAISFTGSHGLPPVQAKLPCFVQCRPCCKVMGICRSALQRQESSPWPSKNPNSIPLSGNPATSCAAAWMPRQYKDYVLVLLFVKYVSDKYAGEPERTDRRARRAAALPTWWRSRATRRSATRSTRSSASWPRPTTSRA